MRTFHVRCPMSLRSVDAPSCLTGTLSLLPPSALRAARHRKVYHL